MPKKKKEEKDELLKVVKKKKVAYPNVYALVFRIESLAQYRVAMQVSFTLEEAIDVSIQELMHTINNEYTNLAETDFMVVSWEVIEHKSLVSRLSSLTK